MVLREPMEEAGHTGRGGTKYRGMEPMKENKGTWRTDPGRAFLQEGGREGRRERSLLPELKSPGVGKAARGCPAHPQARKTEFVVAESPSRNGSRGFPPVICPNDS